MTSILELLKKSGVNLSPVESEELDFHKNFIKKTESKERIVYMHRGIKFPLENESIFSFKIEGKDEGKDFVYIFTPEKEEFVYYFPELENAIENLGKHNDENYYGIDVSEKKYCFELKMNMDKEIYINFITTEPEGCQGGLSALFKILYMFLKKINYKGRIALKDDVQVKGKFITYDRILAGKPSIYEKYGFKPDSERMEKIKKAIHDRDLEKVKKLSRNIPMIAKNYDKFES